MFDISETAADQVSQVTYKRQRILKAAAECYEAEGVGNTTIDDIAEKSGISRRTIYRYFKNKNAIIQALVDEQATALLQRAAAVLKDYEDDFFQLLEQYILYLVRHGPHAPGSQFLLGDKAIHRGEYFYSSKALYDNWLKLLSKPYSKALAEGKIRMYIDIDDLMQWIGRFVFSYISYPVPEEMLKKQLELFVITPLRKDITPSSE